jgi:glutathione peroxidase
LRSQTTTQTIYDIPVRSNAGAALTLNAFRGKVLLVVNVASKMRADTAIRRSEKLYEDRRDEGLEVLGFPANNCKGQEPGSDAEIRQFCSTTYDVKFPLFSKISVVGDDQHPLYQALTGTQPEATGDDPLRERLKEYGMHPPVLEDVLWNFEKFLINRNGRVMGRFAPDVTADDRRRVETRISGI